jgi:hypothetical protein
MLDLFVPTCRFDRAQAQLLCGSISRFSRQTFRSVVFCAVDDGGFYEEMRALPADVHLRLTDLGLGNTDGTYRSGWRLQQAAKLAFARFAETEFYCVLDSKNIALRSIVANDLVKNGQGAQIHEPLSIHESWFRGSAWALGHDNFVASAERVGLSSATPAILHTATARALVDELQQRHRASLDAFFLSRSPVGQPTEFALYAVFLDRENLAERLHFRRDDLLDVETVVWAGHSLEKRRARLERLLSGRTSGLFTGIARPVWKALEPETRRRIAALAVASGETGA